VAAAVKRERQKDVKPDLAAIRTKQDALACELELQVTCTVCQKWATKYSSHCLVAEPVAMRPEGRPGART